ncbi:MAG: hypothetical protein K6L73_07560 [Cellvibrionaceae bacterium]
MSTLQEQAALAANAIVKADGLLITGGAGMGVDSGLPDFRGNEGFWKAYPALGDIGMSFMEAADPANFESHPKLAWGFYGHRLNLYQSTAPHTGFKLLKAMGEQCPKGYFVFTSNVDGHYHKSGFSPERIIECHGSINHLQCSRDCSGKIWPADDIAIEVDNEQCLCLSELPLCPNCNALARPNILMFNDYHWNSARTAAQQQRYQKWLSEIENLVVIECGAGTAVPTVRHQGEYQSGTLIRINPREPQCLKSDSISIQAGALAALTAINEALNTI